MKTSVHDCSCLPVKEKDVEVNDEMNGQTASQFMSMMVMINYLNLYSCEKCSEPNHYSLSSPTLSHSRRETYKQSQRVECMYYYSRKVEFRTMLSKVIIVQQISFCAIFSHS